MKFSELAAYLDQLEATNSRNELVRILSELYGACSVEEIEPITYLIQGRLAPFFEPVEIGLAEKLLLSAMAIAVGAACHATAVAGVVAITIVWHTRCQSWLLRKLRGDGQARGGDDGVGAAVVHVEPAVAAQVGRGGEHDAGHHALCLVGEFWLQHRAA